MTTETLIRTQDFDTLVTEYQKLVDFEICYKNESDFMHFLGKSIRWFCPDFMENYTTVVGKRIYFPSNEYIQENEETAMRTLAHEVVHLLDQKRFSPIVFMLAYLFPQSLILGVFLFPWIGWWALAFLLFLAPIPSPTRFYFESRAYAMNLMTAQPYRRSSLLKFSIGQFASWDYYKMYPFPKLARKAILNWYKKGDKGYDRTLTKVLLIYEMVHES